MQITPAAEQADLIAWAEKQRDLVRKLGDTKTANAIDAAVEVFTQSRFVLAVLGKAKRGKSTLLNATLGRRDDAVAPVDKLPASSTITRFYWSETESAVVHFRNGSTQPIDYSNIREFVTEELNPANRKEVNLVEVGGPFEGMDHDLVLVDTPGAGSIHEYHDQLLQEFIPQADAVLYLVTASMPMDQDELELLQKVKAAEISKIFFALNKMDATSPEDIATAEQHNATVLAKAGIPVPKMHRISAKMAFTGNVAASGLPDLCLEINAFLKQGKAQLLRDRFVERVRQLVAPARQGLELQLAMAQKTGEERKRMRQALEGKKQTILASQTNCERRFEHAWNSAVEAFNSELPAVERETTATLASKINATPVTGVSQLAKDLPTLITRTLDGSLAAITRPLENALREACDVLRVSYPALNVGPSGITTVSAVGDHRGFVEAGAGVALAAAGATVAGVAATVTGPAVAVTTAAPLAAFLANFAGLISPGLASTVAGIGASTTMVAGAAPLWCAIAGPIGWTVAGLGILVVPLSWRKAKLRTKQHLAEAAQEQIRSLFRHLQSDRVPALRRMGVTILEGFRVHLESEIQHCDDAMSKADAPVSSDQLAIWKDLNAQFATLGSPA